MKTCESPYQPKHPSRSILGLGAGPSCSIITVKLARQVTTEESWSGGGPVGNWGSRVESLAIVYLPSQERAFCRQNAEKVRFHLTTMLVSEESNLFDFQ